MTPKPRWWAILGLLLFLTFLSQRQVVDDLWMHLAVGKHVGIPSGSSTPDIFTFVENERPWVPHLWLSSLWMYLAYEAAAMEGVRWFFLITTFLYLLSVALFYRSVGLDAWGMALGVCFVFVLSIDRFRHRPIIFEMMFLFAATAFLFHFWPRLGWRHVVVMYLATALFVNLHSGCLIVPVVVCGWVAGAIGKAISKSEFRNSKQFRISPRWFGVPLAVLLGSISTPYHVHLWIYIFGPKPLLDIVPEYNSTWQYFRNDNFAHIPPMRIPMVLAPWFVMLLIMSPCLWKAFSLLWAFLRRRLRWPKVMARLPEIPAAFPLSLPELLLSLPLMYLSVRHVRFLYMAGIPFGFALAEICRRYSGHAINNAPARSASEESPSLALRASIIRRAASNTPVHSRSWATRLLVPMMTAVCLAYAVWDRLPESVYCVTHPDEHLKPGAFPVEATRFLEEQQASGRIFCNDMLWSTHLLWRLYPDCQTFHDIRHIYGGRNVYDLAAAMQSPSSQQSELLRRFDINIIVSYSAFPFAEQERPRWQLVFKNEEMPFEHVYLRVTGRR